MNAETRPGRARTTGLKATHLARPTVVNSSEYEDAEGWRVWVGLAIAIAAGLLVVIPVLVAALAMITGGPLDRAYQVMQSILAPAHFVDVARWTVTVIFAVIAMWGEAKQLRASRRYSARSPDEA